MNKIISLPILLLVLNFNAQKDFITKYDLKTFVSNNYELIENFCMSEHNFGAILAVTEIHPWPPAAK